MSLRRDLIDRVEAAGFALAAALFRALPLDAGSRFGGWAWRRIAPLTSRHRRALTHLQMAFPELDAAGRSALADAMWDNLGRVFAESFSLDRIEAEPGRMVFGDVEVLHRVARSGRGVVAASLHMGNWELALQAGTRLGFAPAGVYRRLRNPLVEARLLRMRARWAPAGLYAKERTGTEAALALFKVVRRGGAIGILGDLRDPAGVTVPYFGMPALATRFPALVARSVGVPLVALRILRTEGARFRVDAVEVPVPVSADRDADILAATAALHRVYEAWVREAPGQWFWIHRKWAPPGRPDAAA